MKRTIWIALAMALLGTMVFAQAVVQKDFVTGRNVTITIAATDDESGVAGYRVSFDNGATWPEWTEVTNFPGARWSVDVNYTFPVENGEQLVQIQLKDVAGNVSTLSERIVLDTIGPRGSISVTSSP